MCLHAVLQHCNWLSRGSSLHADHSLLLQAPALLLQRLQEVFNLQGTILPPVACLCCRLQCRSCNAFKPEGLGGDEEGGNTQSGSYSGGGGGHGRNSTGRGVSACNTVEVGGGRHSATAGLNAVVRTCWGAPPKHTPTYSPLNVRSCRGCCQELIDVCHPAREAPLKIWADLCSALQIVLFNLPWRADAETLERDFADCGHIEKAEIQHDQDGRSRVSLDLRCFLLDVHVARSRSKL